MGEERIVYRVLFGNPKGKRPLERPMCRWENGIRVIVREISWGGVKLIHLGQDGDWCWAVVIAVMNLWVLVPWF
jgi:hypothetical protein